MTSCRVQRMERKGLNLFDLIIGVTLGVFVGGFALVLVLSLLGAL